MRNALPAPVILLGLLLIFSSGCAHRPIPVFKAHITLPASGDGYWIKIDRSAEGRIPKEEWQQKVKRGITLLSEDWAILRNGLLENCLSDKACDSVVGFFDKLFYTIDDALKKNPLPVKP